MFLVIQNYFFLEKQFLLGFWVLVEIENLIAGCYGVKKYEIRVVYFELDSQIYLIIRLGEYISNLLFYGNSIMGIRIELVMLSYIKSGFDFIRLFFGRNIYFFSLYLCIYL